MTNMRQSNIEGEISSRPPTRGYEISVNASTYKRINKGRLTVEKEGEDSRTAVNTFTSSSLITGRVF